MRSCRLFTRPVTPDSLFVSFDLFVNDWNGAGALGTGGTLDYTQSMPTQFAHVDLLRASSSAFSTSSADIVQNFYLGVDAAPPNPYMSYRFDVSNLTTPGATYQLRFASVQNQFSLNVGVDNVHVTASAAPEPATLPLLALALPVFAAVVNLRRAARFTPIYLMANGKENS